MKKLIALSVVFNMVLIGVHGQNQAETKFQETIQKTNNQKTANTKDILSNYLQAAIGNLFTANNSFSVSPTLYSIDSALFIGNRSNIDNLYRKQRMLRNIQLIDSVKINNPDNDISKLSFSSLSIGFRIAIINKKDITYADFSSKLNSLVQQFETTRKKINIAISNANAHDPAIEKRLNESWNQYSKDHNYQDLDPLIKAEVDKLDEQGRNFIEDDEFHKAFTDISALYARKPLLIFSPSYTYDFTNKQPGYLFAADFTIGLGNDINIKPWELELKSSLLYSKDTAIKTSNLQNKLWSSSAGVNKVLLQNGDKQSTMELKVYFQYDDQLGTLVPGTDAGKITFNSTFRLLVLKTFWLPLTLSYDLKHPNLFGFLSITFNIDKKSSN
jgi:hypothetical protein